MPEGRAVAPGAQDDAAAEDTLEGAAVAGEPLDPVVEAALRHGAALRHETAPPTGRPRMREAAPVDEPPMDRRSARGMLELMLSTEPPSLEEAVYSIRRLTDSMRAAGGLGEDEEFKVTLRALTDAELEELADRAQRDPTREERENGVMVKQHDELQYRRLIVTEALVDPNPHTSEVTSRYGRPEDFVRQWFSAGEIALLYQKVLLLSGWSAGAVELAKKS